MRDGPAKSPSQMERSPETIEAEVREHYDADIVLYYGPISRPYDDFLIDECLKQKRRRNVLLLLYTFGGDAHAAYRIARAFQNAYCSDTPGGGEFLISVSGFCSSAGTLLATGANKLIVSAHAQLGPIDVQMRKPEEVGERTSGLTPIQALQYLSEQSMTVFKQQFQSMRFDPALYFPTSLASKISAEMTSGLVGRLYEQIDPFRVAEIYRLLIVAEEYGKRIACNLKPTALRKLLLDYPAHDFVIDHVEARELFEVVEAPIPALEELVDIQRPHAEKLIYSLEPHVCYLEEEKNEPAQPTNTPAENDADVPRETNNGQPRRTVKKAERE